MRRPWSVTFALEASSIQVPVHNICGFILSKSLTSVSTVHTARDSALPFVDMYKHILAKKASNAITALTPVHDIRILSAIRKSVIMTIKHKDLIGNGQACSKSRSFFFFCSMLYPKQFQRKTCTEPKLSTP